MSTGKLGDSGGCWLRWSFREGQTESKIPWEGRRKRRRNAKNAFWVQRAPVLSFACSGLAPHVPAQLHLRVRFALLYSALLPGLVPRFTTQRHVYSWVLILFPVLVTRNERLLRLLRPT